MDLKIVLRESVSLRPSQPSKRQIIALSGLDRISPAILYTVFFYKSQETSASHHHHEEEDGVEIRAQRALEKVLVPWYPAAGRFKINEETKKLEIDCNDEGVAMVTAVTDSKLNELGSLHEYKPCYEKLVPQLPEAKHISENPLIAVQITRFGCGGYSIGFGGSHALFDGIGAFNFLASWAHTSCANNESHHLPLLPNHSRDALLHAITSPPAPAAAADDDDDSISIYKQNHIAAIQDLYGIPMQAMASDDTCWETALAQFSQIGGGGHHGLQLVTVSVEKQIVETWKGLAIESGKISKCSTFDVLCAYVWKVRVKALDLQPQTNICLQFPVDSRSRLRPPLGDNFAGNAFVLGSVSCLVQELLEQPLHTTIQKIQAAKDAITDEYIKLYVKALESPDKFFPCMRQLTIVADWLKFPFHALDFGWGKVSSAALLATPVPDTAFLMLNLEQPAGGFLVRVGVEGQYVHNFIANFNSFSYY